MKTIASLLVLMLSLSSCYTARVVAPGAPGTSRNVAGATLLWGLTTTETTALECDRGLQSVETYFPWWGYVVSTITVGIVVPIRKEYTCLAAPPAPAPEGLPRR